MSREIKFRAWDKKTERFQSGFHLTSDGKIIFACLIDNEDYILSQFTGLLDKNWKEIFEGDIVRFWANPKDYGGYKGHDYIASVEWDEFSVGFILSDGHGLRDFEFLQVVGNIYQNPELLGGQDE
jgi:uncharacterized phage protein (TIGR01671 family)